MSVQPLSTLVLHALPLSSIIELLDEALSPSDLKIMQDRVTFGNLYREGLLTNELDPTIFYLALEKACPNFIWLSMHWAPFDCDISPEFSPLSPEGLEWLEDKCNGYTIKEIKNKINESLEDLRDDLVIVFNNLGRSFRTMYMEIMVWDYFDGKYRLFYDHICSSKPNIQLFDNLDSLIGTMFSIFLQDEDFDRIHRNLQGEDFDRIDTLPIEPDEILPSHKEVFDALLRIDRIRDRTDEIVKKLWEERKSIETRGRFDLSLRKLSRRQATIRAIGDYLYIFYLEYKPVYFDKTDGRGIIATLTLNEDKWKYVE